MAMLIFYLILFLTDVPFPPSYDFVCFATPFSPLSSPLQLQVQRTPSVKPSKINKIFLTHAHGDHSFGLPGLLCLMGQDRSQDSSPVDIYGPEGLRMWLRVAIRYSVSRIVPNYRVHELKDIPMAPELSLIHISEPTRPY